MPGRGTRVGGEGEYTATPRDGDAYSIKVPEGAGLYINDHGQVTLHETDGDFYIDSIWTDVKSVAPKR